MRKINGYVFIPRFESYGGIIEPLFGPNIGRNGKRNYDNMENNSWTPFECFSDPLDPARRYLSDMSDCREVGFGRISLTVSESMKEFDYFLRRSNLVVIKRFRDLNQVEEKLLGPTVEGKRNFYPLPGAFLVDTDYTTYTFANSKEHAEFHRIEGQSLRIQSPLDRAFDLAREVHRQCQCGALIGQFYLRRFKKRIVRQ